MQGYELSIKYNLCGR